MLMNFLAIAISTFIASYAFIFLKAFQQRNVAFDNYLLIIPISLAMAFTEFYVFANFIEHGYSIWLVSIIGLGSGLGALTAALFHKKWFMKNVKS